MRGRKGTKKVHKPKQTKWESTILPNIHAITSYYRAGMTDSEIAKKLRISMSTYTNAKLRPEMQEIIAITRAETDATVENALYKSAVGYDYDEVSASETTGLLGVITKQKKITKKKVIPNVNAQRYWLENRQPDTWKGTPEALIDANVTIVFSPEDDGL